MMEELHVIQRQGDLTFCQIEVNQFDDRELVDIDAIRDSDNICPDCVEEMEYAGTA